MGPTSLRATLFAANLLEADLSGANISGANIYQWSTVGWKIDGIICTHVYNWNFSGDKEKTRRNFGPGEFEELYKAFPKIELIFKPGYTNLDHRALLTILDQINQRLPEAGATLRKIEETTSTTATIAVKNKDKLNEVAEMIPQGYQMLADKLEEVKRMLPDPKLFNQQMALIPIAEVRYFMELALNKKTFTINQPENMIVGNEVREVRTGDTIDIAAQTVQLGGQAYHLEQADGQAKLLEAIFRQADDPDKFLALLKQAGQQATILSPEAQAGIKAQAEHMLKSRDAGFKAKLKKTWDKITTEGWDMGKGILINVISEVIRKSLVPG